MRVRAAPCPAGAPDRAVAPLDTPPRILPGGLRQLRTTYVYIESGDYRGMHNMYIESGDYRGMHNMCACVLHPVAQEIPSTQVPLTRSVLPIASLLPDMMPKGHS